MCRFLFKGNGEFKQKVIETGVHCSSTSTERGCSVGNDSPILESGSRVHPTLPSLPFTSGASRDSGISRSLECNEPRRQSMSHRGEFVNFLHVEASKRRMSNETASPRYSDCQVQSEPVYNRSCSQEDFPFAFDPANMLDDSTSPHQAEESDQYIKMNRVGLPHMDVGEDTVGYEPVNLVSSSSQLTTTLHQQVASQRFIRPCCPQMPEQLLKEMQELDLYDNCKLRSTPANRPMQQ